MPKPVKLASDVLKKFDIHVGHGGEDYRLDVYVTKRIPGYSRSLMQRFIKEGRVRVNGRSVKSGHAVNVGDRIEVEIPTLIEPQVVPAEIPLDILYEDEHMLAINKPAHFVVHPSAGHWEDTLVNALLHHCGVLATTDDIHRPGIVHRLDKNTSGVILAAKTQTAHRGLSEQFEKRTVEKEYHAIVEGEVAFDSDVIEKDIARHKKYFDKMSVVKDGLGKGAETLYEVLERFRGFTYVKAKPLTGRTHQIRVHLASIGHPCVADDLYGRREALMLKDVDENVQENRALITRQALHAHRIRVLHPVSAEPVEFSAPLAKDMAETLEVLRQCCPLDQG